MVVLASNINLEMKVAQLEQGVQSEEQLQPLKSQWKTLRFFNLHDNI